MNNDIVIEHCSLRSIIDFNFFPILEMDDSWWNTDWLATPLFNRLVKTEAARRKLSDFILRSYQLNSENYFDFASPEKQAALLSSADLKALLYSIGLIIESDTIATVIQKEEQRTIKKSLGKADYLYALKNKISIRRPHTHNKAATLANKVPDYTDFKSHVYQSGLRCLLSLLADMPHGFIQRILFKLPKAWSADIPTPEDGNDYSEFRSWLPRLFKEIGTS